MNESQNQNIQEILNNQNFILISLKDSSEEIPDIFYGNKYNILNPTAALLSFAAILSEFIINSGKKSHAERIKVCEKFLDIIKRGVNSVLKAYK